MTMIKKKLRNSGLNTLSKQQHLQLKDVLVLIQEIIQNKSRNSKWNHKLIINNNNEWTVRPKSLFNNNIKRNNHNQMINWLEQRVKMNVNLIPVEVIDD